ncbi:MAG TPA: hypothetical protein VKA55_08605 [Gammaproteobacteria bacterium]|nr:hypothetical protein [Gammaproteobacteria bacterium]
MTIERVTVMDLEEAAGLPADAETAVISVTDPGVRAPLADGFAHVLRLQFHDVDDAMLEALARLARAPGEEPEPFRAEQARRLVAWAEALAAAPEPLRVAVHCHAGVSRSPAIAWFLNGVYGADLRWRPHFAPNRRVLRLLAEAAGWPPSDPGP